MNSLADYSAYAEHSFPFGIHLFNSRMGDYLRLTSQVEVEPSFPVLVAS